MFSIGTIKSTHTARVLVVVEVERGGRATVALLARAVQSARLGGGYGKGTV